MKFQRLTFLAPMAMLASIALSPQTHAQQYRSKSSPGPAAPTRAEVLADLQVWRASGLATFEVDPSFLLVGSPSHQAARARYEQMRASPEFSALVQAIVTRTGEALPQQLAATDRQAK